MARTSDDGRQRGCRPSSSRRGHAGAQAFGANERQDGLEEPADGAGVLDGVRVPAGQTGIGEEGHGFKFAMAGLDGGRADHCGLIALGGAQARARPSGGIRKERMQFGKALADFQSICSSARLTWGELQAAAGDCCTRPPGAGRQTPGRDAVVRNGKRLSRHGVRGGNDALQVHGRLMAISRLWRGSGSLREPARAPDT